jgi:membrane fusion protein
MNARDESLFRKEVLERRVNRLHGDVSLAMPLSWHIIGFTLLAALVAAVVFLASASYSRVETVNGAIVLDRGLASIVPTRHGRIAALAVRDGQQVRAGDPLVRIRFEEDMVGGGTVSHRIMAALEEQDQRLASQSSLAIDAAGEGQSRLVAQLDGVRRELVSLESQIQSQRRLIEVAEGEFGEMQTVAANGFISRRDLNQREAALITRRQQLAQYEQVRTAKRAEITQIQRGIAQADATARAQTEGSRSSRAQLAQRRIEAETARGYVLTSPIDGTVTALSANLGQQAEEHEPLMVVMPAGGRPSAELYVPTRAAGFLAIGQEVRLAVDAFPYQSFGTMRARIVGISSVAIPRATPEGGTVPVYLVTAELAEPWVNAFGRRQPLLSGMTLTARIVTERQSLLHWLFEPLFAAGRR